MDTAKTIKEFETFLENNRKELCDASTDASKIPPDDEWLQEDTWDDIYQKGNAAEEIMQGTGR